MKRRNRSYFEGRLKYLATCIPLPKPLIYLPYSYKPGKYRLYQLIIADPTNMKEVYSMPNSSLTAEQFDNFLLGMMEATYLIEKIKRLKKKDDKGK